MSFRLLPASIIGTEQVFQSNFKRYVRSQEGTVNRLVLKFYFFFKFILFCLQKASSLSSLVLCKRGKVILLLAANVPCTRACDAGHSVNQVSALPSDALKVHLGTGGRGTRGSQGEGGTGTFLFASSQCHPEPPFFTLAVAV